MRRLLVLALRRSLAAFLLVVGGLPATLELFGHAPGAGEPLHHVEATSVRHHGDHCLVASIAAEKVTPMAAPPVLAVVTDPQVVETVRIEVRPIHPQYRRATSRAPPVIA